MCSLNSKITETTIATALPADFALECKKMFPGETDKWSSFESITGCVRLRPVVYLSDVGISGTLAMGNPPSITEIDAWEASKPAGVWDFYEFLAFVVVPTGKQGNCELVFYFQPNTFFGRPLEVVARLDLSESIKKSANVYAMEDEHERLLSQWNIILSTLRENFGSVSLKDQVWTVQGSQFTAQDPEQ